MKRSGSDPWRLEFLSRPQLGEIEHRARIPNSELLQENTSSGIIKLPAGLQETFVLSDKKTHVRIENRVYTTYLGDMRTRNRCDLPLREIRRLFTHIPSVLVEGRCRMLIFTYRESFLITHAVTDKGVILENGARNSDAGTAVLTRFIRSLRTVGFKNIGILKRTCVNIHGIVNYPFQIALHHFAVVHKDNSRYNESPRCVFFYCKESVSGPTPETGSNHLFEIYQNGTVKCMGAKHITTVAACFEYLTTEISKFVLDESTEKLEEYFKAEYAKEKAQPASRRTKRRAVKARSENGNESSNIPYLPPPIVRIGHDAPPSVLAELIPEDELERSREIERHEGFQKAPRDKVPRKESATLKKKRVNEKRSEITKKRKPSVPKSEKNPSTRKPKVSKKSAVKESKKEPDMGFLGSTSLGVEMWRTLPLL